MDGSAAEVEGVAAELAFDEGVGFLQLGVVKLERVAGFAEEGGAHFYSRGASFWVYAALVGNADDKVEIAHDFAE